MRAPLQIPSPLNNRAHLAPMSHRKYSATTSGKDACARRYTGCLNGGVFGPRGGYSHSPRRVASLSWCDAPAEKTAAAARLLWVNTEVTSAFIQTRGKRGRGGQAGVSNLAVSFLRRTWNLPNKKYYTGVKSTCARQTAPWF